MKIKTTFSFATVFTLCIGLTQPANAGWGDFFDKFLQSDSGSAATTAITGALSNDDIVAGLKEALSNGVEKAINELGRPDGFLANTDLKIPMPDSLRTIESTLRRLRQDRYADQFIETMNRAAEQAVPEAASIFANAIKQMSLDDAKDILNGPDDAATQYFRRTGSEQLTARLRPIVEAATARAGVTSAYKKLVGQASFLTPFMSKDATDVDGYITTKALDGLFTMIAAEEKRIRENPVARTTDILKRVFGK